MNSEMACECRRQHWPLGPSQEPTLQHQPQPDRLTWSEVSYMMERVEVTVVSALRQMSDSLGSE